MWRNVCRFIRRHRRKLYITGGLIGGIILIQKYVGRKISEWEAKQTQELLERVKRQHHFEGTVATCDSTIMSMISKVRERLQTLLGSEALVKQLKTGPSNKIALWDELKIVIFSEIIAEMYCECLFIVILRIQLCIIGGYMYIDSQNDKIGTKRVIATSEIQQQYLSHINHFLNDGIKELITQIKNTVEIAVGGISLKHALMLKDFQIILSSIKQSFCSEQYFIPATSFYVFSETNFTEKGAHSSNNSVLAQMLNETKDIFDSCDFSTVMSNCLERGFAVLMDRLSECFVILNQESDEFKNPHNVAIPLAKLLPTIMKLSKHHAPNEEGSLVPSLLHSALLKDFSANIYETFSHERA